MDINIGQAFFKLINNKKREINDRIKIFNDELRARNLRPYPTQMIYIIYSDIEEGKFPDSVYVGKTKYTIEKRYKQHLNNINRMMGGKTNVSSKYLWMYGIINNDTDLIITKLMDVPENLIYGIEKEWITFFEDCGFNVINRENDRFYEKKIYSYD